jgi:phosphoadenosine phosphosulfate reductase
MSTAHSTSTDAAGAVPILDARVRSATALLREAAALSPAAFSTSLGAEDMVVLDLLHREHLPIEVFTLDTGRLPEETYALLHDLRGRYGDIVRVWFPDANDVQSLVARQGVNGFYESVEQRKACCAVRKLAPLAKALLGKRAWVTGLRAGQSPTRTQLLAREADADRGLVKINPLHDWSESEVWAYLRTHDVPYNALHDQFFPSIGCAPCTRAVAVGEDIRAGRWWWENADSKECGLHPRTSSITLRKEPA